MKQLLRSKVWWHGIDKMAEETVKKCLGCLLDSRPDAPAPMKRRDLPKGPWTDLAIDFLGPLPGSEYILVVVDYYSRYVVAIVMMEITSKKTIKEMIKFFRYFEEFVGFCKTEGITLNSTKWRS